MGEDDFIAAISAFAGLYAPVDYMFCQGQQLPIDQWSALYAQIGPTFTNEASGTLFALPNLQGSTLIGTGVTSTGQAIEIGYTESTASLIHQGAETGAAYAGVGNPVITSLTATQSVGINYVICLSGIWPQRP